MERDIKDKEIRKNEENRRKKNMPFFSHPLFPLVD